MPAFFFRKQVHHQNTFSSYYYNLLFDSQNQNERIQISRRRDRNSKGMFKLNRTKIENKEYSSILFMEISSKICQSQISIHLCSMQNLPMAHKVYRCLIRYKYDNLSEKYVLHKINNYHDHLQQRHLRTNFIENYIQALPSGIKPSFAKQIARKVLKISDSSFYYYFNKVRYVKLSIDELFRQMDELNYNIFTQPFEAKPVNIPDLTIIITPKMKRNFQIFGANQPVCMDTTFNMIKDRHTSGQQYKLGFIVGTSHSQKIVPFCMFLTVDETKQTYLSIIRSFLTVMEKQPSIFITDEAVSMKSAIKQLNDEGIYSGLHGYDIFHVLRNLKPKLKVKQNLIEFAKLAKCQNKKSFERYYQKLMDLIDQEDKPLLEKFARHAIRYSISQIQQVFVGFSISDSIVQKTHDLAKSIIPISKGYACVTKTIASFLEELGQKSLNFKIEQTKYQEIYKYSELKQLRFVLDSKIFKKFLDQFARALYHQIVQESSQAVIVRQQGGLTFQIQQIDEHQWICECGYFVRTGIACSHLILLCIKKDQKLAKYINKRWVLPETIKQVKKKEIRRGKLTRRNRLK